MVTVDEIKHLEMLSNLEFTESERAKFAKDFESILEFASQIQNAKCEGGSFIRTHALSSLREDEIKASLPQEKVVSNAPESARGCFVVPRVVE